MPGIDLGINTGSGPRGASAYETAVENGFVGTEAQWLASLAQPGVGVGDSIVVSLSAPISSIPADTGTTVLFDTVTSQVGASLALVDGVVTTTVPDAIYAITFHAEWIPGSTHNGVRSAYVDLDGDGAYTLGRYNEVTTSAEPAGSAVVPETSPTIIGKITAGVKAFVFPTTDSGLGLGSYTFVSVIRLA